MMKTLVVQCKKKTILFPSLNRLLRLAEEPHFLPFKIELQNTKAKRWKVGCLAPLLLGKEKNPRQGPYCSQHVSLERR